VEKMLEKQFAPYKNEVERLDAQKISAIIEGSTENTLTNVPIPALIWFAVRNGGQDKELETRIFAAIHMKEHLALRFYDELALKPIVSHITPYIISHYNVLCNKKWLKFPHG
jgi:thymidine phosphorylase